VGWLAGGRLMLTLISAQQAHVAAMMADRLGERYLRLDADWSPKAGLGVDVATPAARAHLRAQASRVVAAAPDALLEQFIGMRVAAADEETAPPPAEGASTGAPA